MDIESEYLGITEAAEYLRVSASTLRRWEKKGFLIPERTPTGIRRYTRQQLDDVLNAPEHNLHEQAEHPSSESIKTSLEEEPTEVYAVEQNEIPIEKNNADYYDISYLNNASNDTINTANNTEIVSHRYNPPPVFESFTTDESIEPTLTVMQTEDDHVTVQNQLNQLLDTNSTNLLNHTENQGGGYFHQHTDSDFLETVQRQNINELPSTPNLDSYMARPLAIDMSHVHFDNESFYQVDNHPSQRDEEMEPQVHAPAVYDNSRPKGILRSLGLFVGIFAGFLIVAILAWLVYSNFISGQQNELLRPVI